MVKDTIRYLLTTATDPPSVTELSLRGCFGEYINEVYCYNSTNVLQLNSVFDEATEFQLFSNNCFQQKVSLLLGLFRIQKLSILWKCYIHFCIKPVFALHCLKQMTDTF